MTQSQAAESICTLSLYSKYETQEPYPTSKRLLLLCNRLGIDVDVLQPAIDQYRAIDRQIRLASRRQDFKAMFRQSMKTVQAELTSTVRRRYLDKARIARSVGGGCEVTGAAREVTF